MRSFAVLSAALPLVLANAAELNFPVSVQKRADSKNFPVSVSSGHSFPADFSFTHAGDLVYTGSVSVNGVPFQVILDTGSTDMWIDPSSIGRTPEGLIQTGAKSNWTYLDGVFVEGDVVLGNVSFGGYEVTNQALMLAKGPFPSLVQGLIGLDFTAWSNIHDKLNNTRFAENGRNLMDNIFHFEPEVPNYITVALNRTVGPALADGGVFTISQLISNETAILAQPRLPRLTHKGPWLLPLEGVHVNGQFLTGHSNRTQLYQDVLQPYAATLPDERKAALQNATVISLDTGTATMMGPRAYVDAIFKDIPGAELVQDSGMLLGLPGYKIPCDTKLNVSFQFAGQQYPVHPVDMVSVNFTAPGSFFCVGSIAIIDYDNVNIPVTDWVLGDSFLQNVYALYDYANETNGRDEPAPAYVQILSTTNATRAWLETDQKLLDRIVTYEESFQVPPSNSTPPPIYTGPAENISLTSIDNAQATGGPNSTLGNANTPPNSASGLGVARSALVAVVVACLAAVL